MPHAAFTAAALADPAAFPSPTSRAAPSAAPNAALIEVRSSSVSSPKCNSPSTNSRSPRSVGSRPAEVCGAYSA